MKFIVLTTVIWVQILQFKIQGQIFFKLYTDKLNLKYSRQSSICIAIRLRIELPYLISMTKFYCVKANVVHAEDAGGYMSIYENVVSRSSSIYVVQYFTTPSFKTSSGSLNCM